MINTHLVHYSVVYNRLQKLRDKISGRSYTAGNFTNMIRRQFPATDYIFKTFKDLSLDPDTIIVSGLYDCYDDANHLPSITITLCYHPAQQIYFVDLLNWDQFSFDMAECIGHEMVHRHQYQFGRAPALKQYHSTHPDSMVSDEQNYLGAEDEIEAYGFSIAAEMHAFKKPINECVMYGVYRNTFEHDTSIVLKLETQVEQYYKELEQIYE